ncbi:hypothetical protein EJ04DRAFT_453490 [Polyplosphaeria fusca]|uniref:Uncharacterized protein n=1 Tax=Polyplosphaeria fusca TaxID=682080 RepID=A0A9P4R8X8_9PLEO|nr:hypothetical protein EJ04DRAFT_453490 [Polyplosphaeria fusca]
MWTANRPPSRPQRTPSVQSVGSVHSAGRPTSMVSPQLQRRSGYESDSSTATEEDFVIQNANFPAVPSHNMPNMPPMWQSQRQQSGSAVSRLSQKFGSNVQLSEIQAPPAPLRTQHRHQQEHAESSPDDDTHSRTSTLGGDEQDFEYPEKTPTLLPKKMQKSDERPEEPKVAPHVAGPLEQQLSALMSKLVFMERENPVVSVTPEEYKALNERVATLEAEKKAWQKRHEALFALRDEDDVANNIVIRGMLAKTRRDLAGMTQLRDDDLTNLHEVRVKLADATRKLDAAAASAESPRTGRMSPSRGRPGSMLLERRDTTDLFAAAKAAALEQRALELEKRNQDLLNQIEHLKAGNVHGAPVAGMPIDELNKMTAHKAWRDTVADLELKLKEKDAQMARMRSGGAAPARAMPAAPVAGGAGGVSTHHLEAVHEEHAGYREKMGARVQALRSEKEALQRELHRKEDENHMLDAKVQSLTRRVSMFV